MRALEQVDYAKKYPQLIVDKHADGITVLKFNNPAELNAFSGSLHQQMEHIMLDLKEDPEVNVIVLTGEGRAFSSGGNVKAMADRSGTPAMWKYVVDTMHGPKALLEGIFGCYKPVIAAVNGDAIGLGATIALACDIQVIADTARFGDTHVRVGLVAGDGGAITWPLLVGPNRAKDFLMRGLLVKGAEAERMHLVNYSVPADQVMAKAMEIATELNRLPPLAVRLTKVSVNKMLRAQLNLMQDASIAYEFLTMLSEDHGEAASAFAEKRKPTFKGI